MNFRTTLTYSKLDQIKTSQPYVGKVLVTPKHLHTHLKFMTPTMTAQTFRYETWTLLLLPAWESPIRWLPHLREAI